MGRCSVEGLEFCVGVAEPGLDPVTVRSWVRGSAAHLAGIGVIEVIADQLMKLVKERWPGVEWFVEVGAEDYDVAIQLYEKA